MNALERWYFDVPGGMFREFEGITCHFRPKDTALYRKLLPTQFDMPRQPVVHVFFANYLRVLGWPYKRYRYQEWAAVLRGAWRGEEAGYMLAITVTTRLANALGRYLGFPKYISDVIMSKRGDAWLGTGVNQGVTEVSLEFCPGLPRPLQDWEQELVGNGSLFKEDALVLVPAGRGPRAQRVHLKHVVPPEWKAVPGMVRLVADPGQSWAGLVPEGGEFAGSRNTFRGGINLITMR